MLPLISWGPPSREQQRACLDASGGAFNYPAAFHGATAAADPAALSAAGFHVNRSRVLLGSGPDTFRLAKSALLSWRHFRLGWAFVEQDTAVEQGTGFCVCVKEVLPWLAMPLRVAYVADREGRFGFGSGTLRGHLLAGEERFTVERDEEGRVFYEVFSFSKPAHPLAAIATPYVRLRQKFFAEESARALAEHLTSELRNGTSGRDGTDDVW
ncbi:outer envelope protein [Wolffia australiana]